MYTRKRHGVSTDVWVTPDRTGQVHKFSPSSTENCPKGKPDSCNHLMVYT